MKKLERLAAIGQSVAALSHEARNELCSLKIGLDLLERTLRNDEEAGVILGHLRDVHFNLHRLLEDVRHFAGPLRLERKPSDLAQVWRRAWDDLEPIRRDRRAVLREQMPAGPLRCMVDPFRLEQVFRNLFENSLAACEDPAVVSVACYADDRRGVFHIEARDNGPGLSREQAARVFDPFYTTKANGTGLGMAIAQRIVEAHGGGIHVAEPSQPGARFWICLPCVGDLAAGRSAESHLQEDEDADERATDAAAEAAADERKILVVDDQRSNGELMRRLLGTLGQSRVRIALDGASAVEAAKQFAPDLVFLDLNLPDLSGYDVARTLRHVPKLSHVQIVALTGHPQDPARAQWRSAGIDEYLLKPVSLDKIRSILAAPLARGRRGLQPVG